MMRKLIPNLMTLSSFCVFVGLHQSTAGSAPLAAVTNLSPKAEEPQANSTPIQQSEISADQLKASLLADLRSKALQNSHEIFYINQYPKLLAYLFLAAKDRINAEKLLTSAKSTPEQVEILRNTQATKEAMQRLNILEGLALGKAAENIAKVVKQLDMESDKGLSAPYMGLVHLPYESKLRSESLPAGNVHPLLFNRWSSLALSREPLSQEVISTLVDAARWAPSSFNNQPWRFIYAHHGSESWEKIFHTIQSRNQRWVNEAAVFFVLLSKKTLNLTGKFDKAHSFGAGAACQNLLLQAYSMNLVTRCMDRFDFEKLRDALFIPDEYDIEVIIAVGKPGDHNKLPADLQKRNRPSDRMPIEEILFEGTFPSEASTHP